MTTTSAVDTYERVLAGAGCRLPMQDAVDERIVADVRQRTTRLINNPDEVGGWPDLAAGTAPPDTDHDGMPDDWEKSHGLNPSDASDGMGDTDQDGYTNVEEFLNNTSPIVKES